MKERLDEIYNRMFNGDFAKEYAANRYKKRHEGGGSWKSHLAAAFTHGYARACSERDPLLLEAMEALKQHCYCNEKTCDVCKTLTSVNKKLESM